MCLLADMIQQEKSRYKGEFAEACVTLALERSTGCKLVTRRDSVSPEVAKTLDFPLNFVEFLNRSYPVVQAAMGNASVCDIFFAQHCQHSALTKALCINEMRWILIDFIQPPGKLLWWPLPRGCGEIPGLLQATSTTPWLSWAEKSIWQRCSMLETAQNSWMSSEISNWKRGTSASNHLVLRLRDDVDTDAAPSPLVEARRGTCQPVPEFTCSWFVCFSSRFWRIFLPQCDPCWRETPWAERVVPVRRLKSGVGSGFAARTSATRRFDHEPAEFAFHASSRNTKEREPLDVQRLPRCGHNFFAYAHCQIFLGNVRRWGSAALVCLPYERNVVLLKLRHHDSPTRMHNKSQSNNNLSLSDMESRILLAQLAAKQMHSSRIQGCVKDQMQGASSICKAFILNGSIAFFLWKTLSLGRGHSKPGFGISFFQMPCLTSVVFHGCPSMTHTT